MKILFVLPPDGGDDLFWPRLSGGEIEGARDCSSRRREAGNYPQAHVHNAADVRTMPPNAVIASSLGHAA